MAYVAPTTRTTGDLVTAAIWNQDVVANPIGLYAGEMAIASQAANNLIYATSATQLGRIAAAASSVLITSAGSVPSLSQTLPSAVQDLITRTGTITSGVWNAGAVTSSGTITGVAGAFSGLLTVTAIGTHSFTGGSNAAQTLGLTNTTSGTAGRVEELQTAGTAVGRLCTFSQGFTTSALSQLSSTLLEAQAAGGLSIAASHASGAIRFCSGGTASRGLFLAGGDLLIGAITALPTGTTNGKAFDVGNALAMRSSVTTTGAQNHIVFYNGNGEVGNIQTNASATAFNTSSDRRLKNDRGLTSNISALRSVEIHDFAWKVDGVVARGVFAQDAFLVFPSAVSVGTDKLDTRGNLEQPWSVDYSKFVPDLIVGWQQHDATIMALTARIAALERKQ